MNRPRKHAAGVEHQEKASEARTRAVGGVDVARRLLQLVSLALLFVFGLLGTTLLLVHESHAGGSRPMLQRGLSHRLRQFPEHRGQSHKAARYSPPVTLSLIVAHQSDDEDALMGIVQRFLPDFLVMSSGALDAGDLPSSHRQYVGLHQSVVFDRDVWELQQQSKSVDNNVWEAAFRHWHVGATLFLCANCSRSESEALILISPPQSTVPGVVDPFKALSVAGYDTSVSTVAANAYLRPVAATALRVSSGSPVSVVYELLLKTND